MGAVGGVGLKADAIDATLTDVINGRAAGRTSPDQITVFGAVGLPFQDIAALWPVYLAVRKAEDAPRILFLD